MEEEEDASRDTVIELRQEPMVSRDHLINRTAYFLKPSIKTSVKDSPPPPPSETAASSKPPPPEVRYYGWLTPHREWKQWVKRMRPRYEHVWVQAGIDQAIKASTYQINRNDELILALARKWRPETNTFVFPWGEATVTLEDVRVCGGYSVLGGVFSAAIETEGETEAEDELVEIRRALVRTKAKKAAHLPWIMHFKSNESRVEHEGFLSLWLSRFVFPASGIHTVLKCVFPIAIRLARGTRIALAPPVLASIYRDLSLLSGGIDGDSDALESGVSLWAPFQLVQTWALERFPALQPRPRAIKYGQPRVARWHEAKMAKNYNLGLILDSAGDRDCFLWRPYENSPPLRIFNERDMWECDNPDMDRELWSFGRCLRVSELVGMGGCVEQYLPHRVAMQFGMDQDIPGVVVASRSDVDPGVSYSEPIFDMNLRSALLRDCDFQCQPSVTSRYYDWWNQSKLGKEGDATRKGDDFDSKSERNDQAAGDDSDDLEDLLTIKEPLLSNSSKKVECSKDLSSPQIRALQSSSSIGVETAASMAGGGVCSFDQGKDAVSRSKSTTEDGQTEDIVGGAGKAKGAAETKGPFCETSSVIGMEWDGAGPYDVDIPIASFLENQISELERVVAKLKAAKFRPKAAKS